jgi:hypothetical protein
MSTQPPGRRDDITGHVSGDSEDLRSKTVSDFGEQWTYFTENDGNYASDVFFADLLEPLLRPDDSKDVTCVEIGAGTDNIAAMALRAGVRHFTVVEPSDAASLTFALPLRALSVLSYVLDGMLAPFVFLAKRRIKIPLADYLRDVYGKLASAGRRVAIVDQLKPAWALYYTETEAHDLLKRAGFENVRLHHRHGYRRSVLGQKPEAAAAAEA